MQSPQPMQNILYHEYLSIERSRSKEISFLQRLSYNVFLTTSFSQRHSQNVFLTTSFSQRISHSVFFTPLPLYNHPHNVVLITSQYTRNLSMLYKYLKIYQIRLSSNPRNFAIFGRSNWNLDVSHLLYIFYHFVKFLNPRTEASYHNAADKVLQISQNIPNSSKFKPP